MFSEYNPSPLLSINVSGSGKTSDNMTPINITLGEGGHFYSWNQTKCVKNFSMIVVLLMYTWEDNLTWVTKCYQWLGSNTTNWLLLPNSQVCCTSFNFNSNRSLFLLHTFGQILVKRESLPYFCSIINAMNCQDTWSIN